MLKAPELESAAQHAPNGCINDLERHPSSLNLGFERCSIAINSRQLHIEPSQQSEPSGLPWSCRDMMVGHELQDGRVVRDHHACKTQFVTQQLGQNGGTACTGQAIDGGIGVHDRGKSGITDHGSEGLSVDLTQLPWTHLNGTPVASPFRHGVAKEVLGCGGNSVTKVIAL